MTAMTRSPFLEIIREVILGCDLSARQPEPERLSGERVDLRSVALEPVWMKVLAHHGCRVLELGLEPRRRVRKALLRSGEAVVGGAEGIGETLRDEAIGLPRLAAQHD